MPTNAFMPQCLGCPMCQNFPMSGNMLNPNALFMMVGPLVDYALKEAQYTSDKHAITEVVLIAYLMGLGYNMGMAHQIVESWEVNETFPFQRNV